MKITLAFLIGVITLSMAAAYQDTDLRTLLDALEQSLRADSGDAPSMKTSKRADWEKEFRSRAECERQWKLELDGHCISHPYRRDMPDVDALAFLNKRGKSLNGLYHECCDESCSMEEFGEHCTQRPESQEGFNPFKLGK
ncbi:uncharacterized protein [Amphiura filiformis]|uniref:uncharacterized protein n=1 Tax=Amphiura filiformis TaxID=82378 RepID=UPI003B2228D5